MANAVFSKAKEHFMRGDINLLGDTVRALLVDGADYTFSAAHESLADIPAGARVASSPALANKSVTNGVFDADDTTISGVTGDEFEILVVYVDSGTEATSYLISYHDEQGAFIPNGGDVNVEWGNTGSKIVQI